jgi:predicted metalloenzyme YecM
MHPFLTQLFNNLSSIHVDVTGLTIDHIAYRASTTEEADQLKQLWMRDGVLVKAAQVNGREVDIFELSTPIECEWFEIICTELMYPKPSKPYGGWDHIEVVLWPYTPSIDILRERVLARFPDIARNAWELYSYEEDWLHAVSDQVLNPVITIRFIDKTAVRFHTADIRDIIAMEG